MKTLFHSSNLRISALCLTAMLLSGCITGGGTKDDDSTRTQAEGTVIGALLGAGLGHLLGGDTESALIGAAIGGGAGFVLGNEVAKRKKQYKNQEALIEGESRYVADMVVQTKSLNQALKNDINSYRSSVNTLNAKLKADEKQKSTLQVKKEEIDKRYTEANQSLSAVKNELETAETLYQEAQKNKQEDQQKPLQTWHQRINDLKMQKVRLEQNTQQLQAVSHSIAI